MRAIFATESIPHFGYGLDQVATLSGVMWPPLNIISEVEGCRVSSLNCLINVIGNIRVDSIPRFRRRGDVGKADAATQFATELILCGTTNRHCVAVVVQIIAGRDASIPGQTDKTGVSLKAWSTPPVTVQPSFQ